MTDLNDLTQRAANHLAGQPVIIRWQRPPSESAAGQTIKTPAGEMVVYVSPNLTGVETRFRVLLHELAHCRHDCGWIPISTDHQQPGGSIKRDPAARAAWRADPREERANQQAAAWLQYAERNSYKYFTGYQTPMECKLQALLDWRE